MKVTPAAPFASLHGQVLGKESGFHLRTNKKTNKCFTYRNPHHKPPTEAQQAQTSKMKQAIAYYKQVQADPLLKQQLQQEFEQQTRYHRFYDFVRSKILCSG